MNRKKKRSMKPKQISVFGKLLAKLPNTWPILYPFYLANQLDTVREVYPSEYVPKEFHGFTIAFVSDIHYGFLLNEQRVKNLVEKVNAFQADLILLGGDYGENSQGAIDFFKLRPSFSAKEKVIGVLGNHDRTDPSENYPLLLEEMKKNGILPLVNDVFILQREGKKLAIAGTDDYFMGDVDLRHTAYLCRESDFTILAAHNPDILPETFRLPGGPFYQLALCGHTHGGQVSIGSHAIHSSSMYGDRFLSGWKHENGVDILISNGVGTSGFPVRLGARPQIHLITLISI